jgi:hypothetical protein
VASALGCGVAPRLGRVERSCGPGPSWKQAGVERWVVLEKNSPLFLVFSFEFKCKHKFTDYVDAQPE